MISFNESDAYFAIIIGTLNIFLSAVTLIIRAYPNAQVNFLADLFLILAIITSFVLIIFGLLVIRIVKRKKQALRALQ